MNLVEPARRPGLLSLVMIVTSIGLTVALSLAMDVVLLRDASAVASVTVISAILFNVTVILRAIRAALRPTSVDLWLRRGADR